MAGKTCGSCGVCCNILRIDELKKPARQDCTYLRVVKPKSPNKCQNYANRPVACSEFKCLWLSNDFDKRFRPDRSGIMMVAYNLGPPVGTCVQILETEKGAYDRWINCLDDVMKLTRWPTGAIILREDHRGQRYLVGGPFMRVKAYRKFRDQQRRIFLKKSVKTQMNRALEQVTVDVDPRHIRWSVL